MATPQRESDLQRWIEISERLRPIENLTLIGLQFLKPQLPLSIIAVSNPMEEENIRATEKWASSRFRQLLLFYCQHYKKPQAVAAAEILDKAEVVKGLAPLIVTTLSMPLGIAVNFLFWALGYSLDEWCQKYARRKYNGKGLYKGNFPGREIDSFFDVSYLPPIEEIVEDPEAYPLEGYKIRIKVREETTGKVKLPTSEEVNLITFNFKGKNTHFFKFIDTQTSKAVGGGIENVFPEEKDGPNIIGFTSGNLVLKDRLEQIKDRSISKPIAASGEAKQDKVGQSILISAAAGLVLGLLIRGPRR